MGTFRLGVALTGEGMCRLPSEPGGAVAVLPHELEATLYRAEEGDWPPAGHRAAACRAIAAHLSQVC
jgi:hypothetical protein